MDALITLLPGDGIGPEVTAAAHRVLKAVADRYDHSFHYNVHLIGGADVAAELDAKRAIKQGSQIAAEL